jgi:hypothetical protein
LQKTQKARLVSATGDRHQESHFLLSEHDIGRRRMIAANNRHSIWQAWRQRRVAGEQRLAYIGYSGRVADCHL